MKCRSRHATGLGFALLMGSWISPAVANAQSLTPDSRPSSDTPASSSENPSVSVSSVSPGPATATPSSEASNTIEPIAVTPTTNDSRPNDAPNAVSVVVDHEPARPNASEPIAPHATRWEAWLGADFAYATRLTNSAFSGPTPSVFAGDGAVGARWFVRPVVDDDAPRSLQPYLQRTSMISLRAEGYGSRTVVTGIPSGSSTSGVWTHLDFDQYAAPFFAVWGSIGTDYASAVTTSFTTIGSSVMTGRSSDAYQFALPVSAGVGVRIRDTRVDLGYGFTPYVTSITPWQVPFWAHVSTSVTTVIDRTIALMFAADVLHWGVRTSVRGDVFPTRNLGIHLRALFARWSPDPSYAITQVIGAAGITYWFSSKFGATAEHTIEWGRATDSSLENTFSVGAFARW